MPKYHPEITCKLQGESIPFLWRDPVVTLLTKEFKLASLQVRQSRIVFLMGVIGHTWLYPQSDLAII